MALVRCVHCSTETDPFETAGYCDQCGKKLPGIYTPQTVSTPAKPHNAQVRHIARQLVFWLVTGASLGVLVGASLDVLVSFKRVRTIHADAFDPNKTPVVSERTEFQLDRSLPWASRTCFIGLMAGGVFGLVRSFKKHNPTNRTGAAKLDRFLLVVFCVLLIPPFSLLAWHVKRAYDYRTSLQDHDELSLAGHKGNVLCVAFSPDGHLVASGGIDNTVKLWDCRTGHLLNSLNAGETVWHIAFAPNRPLIATGDHRGKVKLWNIETFELETTLDVDTDTIHGLTFSPDGNTLAAVGYRLTFWEVESRQRKWPELSARIPQYGGAVAFSPNGKLLAAKDASTIVIWSVPSGELMAKFTLKQWAEDLAFSPDGKMLVAAGGDSKLVHLWQVDTWKEVATFEGKSSAESIAISPDGKYVVVVGGGDPTVRLWDLESRRELARIPCRKSGLVSVALSSDGARLAATGYGELVYVWDFPKEIAKAQQGKTAAGTVDQR